MFLKSPLTTEPTSMDHGIKKRGKTPPKEKEIKWHSKQPKARLHANQDTNRDENDGERSKAQNIRRKSETTSYELWPAGETTVMIGQCVPEDRGF